MIVFLLAAALVFPAGPDGDAIRYGYSLVTQTPKLMPKNVVAGMSCSACHLNAGRKAHAGSYVGIYATYPQWEARTKRVIALQDRVAECFLYSMNGTPPAYDSREMISITAYIAFLSRGAPVGTGVPNQGFVKVQGTRPGNNRNGASIYTAQCAMCHGAGGAGNAQANIPPLWGPKSFNDGAGMNYGLKFKLAEFVKANMPVGREGSLTDQQAIDVATFIGAHPRPHFQADRMITFPSRKAGFY